MSGLVRGTFTLVGVGLAGFFIWLATYLEFETRGEWWGIMGLVAACGLVMGLSQLFGGWTKWGWPRISPGVFLLGFLPALVMAGWILLVAQPLGGGGQSRVADWSGSLGIRGFVEDMGAFAPALAFGLGLVLAFVFDTTGPREPAALPAAAPAYEHDYEETTTPSAAADGGEVEESELSSPRVG